MRTSFVKQMISGNEDNRFSTHLSVDNESGVSFLLKDKKSGLSVDPVSGKASCLVGDGKAKLDIIQNSVHIEL